MIDKPKLKNNDDIITTERHISFVTNYSIAECLQQLDGLKQDKSNKITLLIHSNNDDLINFSLIGETRQVLKGTIQLQDDGTCVVHAKVNQIHDEVMSVLTVAIMFLTCGFLGHLGHFVICGVIALLAALIIALISQSKSDIPHLHNLLIQTLYTPTAI